MLGSKETMFTIGNGYLGTRGTFEEGFPGENCCHTFCTVFLMIAPIGFTRTGEYSPTGLDLRFYLGRADFPP